MLQKNLIALLNLFLLSTFLPLCYGILANDVSFIEVGMSRERINASERSIYVPDDYETIQESVDAANSGDALLVRPERLPSPRTCTSAVYCAFNQKTYILGGQTDPDEGISTNDIVGYDPLNGTVGYKRDPIVISGDQGFTKENGVVRGLGTVEDPYLIEGWYINYSQRGITVANTRAYFVIRNVKLYGSGMNYGIGGGGIYFSNVRNGKIENVTVTNTPYGIQLSSSSYCVIAGNTISRCYDGITIGYHSDHNIIRENTVSDNAQSGIAIDNSNYNQAINNTISDNGYIYTTVSGRGFQIQDNARYNLIANNTIFRNSLSGIVIIIDSHSNRIICNNISFNDVGISIGSVINNLEIYWNNFIKNRIHVDIFTDSLNITWNFEGKGNYWSDYGGVDIDGDGIGEIVYKLSSYTDYFPLVAPYSPTKKLGFNIVWWLWFSIGLGAIIVAAVAVLLTNKINLQKDGSQNISLVILNILLIVSAVAFLFVFLTRILLHDLEGVFLRVLPLAVIVYLLRKRWSSRFVFALGTVCMIYGSLTPIFLSAGVESVRSQWLVIDGIGFVLGLFSMLFVTPYHRQPTLQEQKLKELLERKGRVKVGEISEITGMDFKDIRHLLSGLVNRYPSLQGFFVNDDREFVLESVLISSINGLGRFDFVELGASLDISIDQAKEIFSELHRQGKIKGTFTLDGRVFITGDRLREEIMGSIR